MIHIRQALAHDEALMKGLCVLLTDVVEGGASVGFLAPIARQTAEDYWEKVFVLASHRGQGLARKLLAAAESFAETIGRTLLVLDTESGSVAEGVYRHLGWQRAGEIPNFALTPDGRLHTTVYYYKLSRTGP